MNSVRSITVSFNSAEDLGPCLDALKRTLGEDITVVDNGSTDHSVSVAKSNGAKVLAGHGNVGFGRANNLGAVEHAAAYKYIWFVNPDCIVDSACLFALKQAIDADPRVGAVVPSMKYLDGKFGIAGGHAPSLFKEYLAAFRIDAFIPKNWIKRLSSSTMLLRYFPLLSYGIVGPGRGVVDQGWLSGFCMLVRSEAFFQSGGFDDRFFLYFEDVDLSVRLRSLGWTLAEVSSAIAVHAESTSTGTRKSSYYFDGMVTYFDKHGSRFEQVAARILRSIAS